MPTGNLIPTRNALIELCPWGTDWVPPATIPYASFLGRSSDAVQNEKRPVVKVPVYGGAPFSSSGYAEFTVGCKIFIDLKTGGVTSIAVTNPGTTPYTSDPTVTIASGGGSGATAVAIRNTAGQIVAIVVTNPGSGYTSVPTVTIANGGGSGATAVAKINQYSSATDYPTFKAEQVQIRISPAGNGASSQKPFWKSIIVPETLNMDLPVNGVFGFTFQAQGSGDPILGEY